jgi:hypothetical protein
MHDTEDRAFGAVLGIDGGAHDAATLASASSDNRLAERVQ